MPRDGGGVYSYPPNTAPGPPNTVIDSTKANSRGDDLETDANTPRPVVAGGTGATNAGDARENLGVVAIGTTNAAGTNTITAQGSAGTITAYLVGSLYSLTPANDITGSSTLNIDSLGAVTINKEGGQTLNPGDMVAGGSYLMEYQTSPSTRFMLISWGAKNRSVYRLASVAGTNTITAVAADFTPDAYIDNVLYTFRAAGTNTSDVSLNINGIGQRNILSVGGQQLDAGALQTNDSYTVQFTSVGGDSFRLVSGEINTLDSLGGDTSLVGAKTGVKLGVRGISANTVDGLLAAEGANTVTISKTAGVRQEIVTATGAVGTTTNQIPQDDTIPQITEGAEFISLTITPKSSTSRLHISAVIMGWSGINADIGQTYALFMDSDADAIAAVGARTTDASSGSVATLEHARLANTTSPITFRIRCGNDTADTFTFNGQNGSRLYGSAQKSTMRIVEYVV